MAVRGWDVWGNHECIRGPVVIDNSSRTRRLLRSITVMNTLVASPFLRTTLPAAVYATMTMMRHLLSSLLHAVQVRPRDQP